MSGSVTLESAGRSARVRLANPGKLNAIDVAMWGELQRVFEALQALPAADAPVAVIVEGADGQFASGGDVHEFTSFRFDEAKLQHFHERVVGPALQAIVDCDIPVLAQIEGACVGGGLEIAACCDIRVCGEGSRFGAPIARLGFPMAPGELQVLRRIAPTQVLREMLLEARLLDAAAALRLGLVHEVVADAQVGGTVDLRAAYIATLSPQAARLNKRTLRQLDRGELSDDERRSHYSYASSDEHIEGVIAFIEKRSPRFQRG